MRYFILFVVSIAVVAAIGNHALVGQQVEQQNFSQKIADQQQKLRESKRRNRDSLKRSNILSAQADSANREAERFQLEKRAINATIEAAKANLDAASARIAIITERQSSQKRILASQTSPILRLMGALENMTRRPVALMVLQPQSLDDYVHTRAVMASIQPRIEQQTSGIRSQIDLQQNLRDQQKVALQSLQDAQKDLVDRQTALAKLESQSRDRSGALNADAAIEFERAIAAGERARDIVETIDDIQDSEDVLSALSALEGPKILDDMERNSRNSETGKIAYVLPVPSKITTGFGELDDNGYRERGITLAVDLDVIRAPASGKISYAGRYRNYGHIVIIEHGGGWNTLVTNMSSLLVSKESFVEQGQSIGRVKNRDRLIGMELRRNGKPFDIMAIVTG